MKLCMVLSFVYIGIHINSDGKGLRANLVIQRLMNNTSGAVADQSAANICMAYR